MFFLFRAVRTAHIFRQTSFIHSRLARYRPVLQRPMPSRDAGMTTAEYAVGTLAAVAFAVVLYRVVTSTAVADAVHNIVMSALNSV